MIIGCTKKLQSELGITVEHNNEDNDFYSWSANVITIKRRKTVVVVNDSNRFGFVLYGLKAKDFKIIDKLIVEGIRNSLKAEKIKEEIIEQYLKEAGTICFSKTRGPKCVARLNKACQRVSLYEEVLEIANIYQSESTKIINNDFVGGDKDCYMHPYELLMKDFKLVYGEAIVKCRAANLLVNLNLGSYIAKRSIMTPIDINFKQLHYILQSAFNWRECHLHEFNVVNEKCECVLNVISEFDEMVGLRQDCKMALESEIFISDYIKDGFRIFYCYDFGDNWQHEIIIKGTIDDYNNNYVICVEGVGDAPPEDVGGILGYEEFLEIMADPNNPEYEEMKRWSAGQLYRKFDVELINRRLKYVLRR